MGDLGNFVEYANQFPSYSRLAVHCELAEDKIADLKVSRYDEHDIYVQVPQECYLTVNASKVLKV